MMSNVNRQSHGAFCWWSCLGSASGFGTRPTPLYDDDIDDVKL